MMLKVEKICREIGKYLLRYRASIISNYTELSMKTFYDDKNENGYQESIKVNLGERRSTINSVTPKIAGEVCNILLKIEDFEFNIFELDKLIGKDTMLYMSNEILILDFIGTFAFASYGSYFAVKKDFDIFGIFVCAFLSTSTAGDSFPLFTK